MKICVIGNSHVSALKLAWEAIHKDQYASALDFVFFAQVKSEILELLTVESRFIPSSEKQRQQIEFISGGYSLIDPEAFDAFLVYGLSVPPLLKEDGGRYSQAVREAAVIDRATSQASYRMVQRLRAITRKPIFVSLSPLRANVSGGSLPVPLMPYSDEIEFLSRKVFAPLDAQLVSQPLETIVGGRATAPEYTVGSCRLMIDAARKDDNIHMNEAYGRVWLMNFQRWLASEAILAA